MVFMNSLWVLDDGVMRRSRTLNIGEDVDAGAEGRQAVVLDVVFVAVTLIFFALGVGYVALCERLSSK
jgi:hypothetical protein